MAWQNIQERGNTFCLRVTLLLYKLIGRHLLKCLIAPLVIFWYWLFTPRLRRASRQYLDRITPYLQAAPDKPLSTYRHLLHFAWVFVDKLAGWLGDVSEDELVLQGHEHFRAHYGKGALIITTHFGNMELLRALKADSDQVINVLVYNKHTEHFNRLLKHINPNALVRLISVDELGIDTAMYLQERLDAGEWLMVAADRTPIQSQRTDVLPFFGYDSAWPQGGWLLASLLKCPVMAVFCYPYQGKQHVSIHMLSECFSFPRKERKARLRRIMQDYVTLVEQHCILTPYQWFNFYPFWDEQNPDNETKVVAEHV